MKKFLVCMTTLLIFVIGLSGCGCDNTDETTSPTEAVTEPEGETLPIEDGLNLIYSSGAGAWEAHIYLNADGTFTGGYQDMNAGEGGEGYDATVYQSEFKGKFKDIKMVEDYAFTMTLENVETEKPEGTEAIEEWNGQVAVRVVNTAPFGIAGGEEFLFYLPTAPISELSEEFLSWNPARGEKTETLERYGLYNIVTDAGFFTYD
ncbi:MAG: hypothetical protein IJ316_05035 [Clostridia bacterium]|nr:hypothetical protein [Clostridia bacterium]